MTDFLLNKEALREMAGSPAFKSFRFLAPVRAGRPLVRNSGCSSCQKTVGPQNSPYISDALQEVILQTLVPGGSFANEVSDLKRAVEARVLVLPTQQGIVRI